MQKKRIITLSMAPRIVCKELFFHPLQVRLPVAFCQNAQAAEKPVIFISSRFDACYAFGRPTLAKTG